MSAAQATEIMNDLVHRVPSDKVHEYWHVACARVADKWRLNEHDHTQIFCYYAWDPAYATQLVRDTPLGDLIKLQNKVLSHLGRSDHVEFARSRRVSEFAARLIASNLAAGSSGSRHDVCAVCLDDCEDGSPLFTCDECANRLHARCCRSWVIANRGHEEDATCPYCRAPVARGKFSIGELRAAPESASPNKRARSPTLSDTFENGNGERRVAPCII